VHGGEPPALSSKEVHAFAWDVRRALGEDLEFAGAEGLQGRGRLPNALENHSDRERLVCWLRENGDSKWNELPTTPSSAS
jgi:hypothetical protein